MIEEPHLPWIAPELEARIVALVLGEASDYERAELERLIEERPELATFRKRIDAAHGLLSDLGSGESAVDDDGWKLSDEKRSAVLAVLDTETSEQPAGEPVHASVKKPVKSYFEIRRAQHENFVWKFGRIAAVLCVIGLLGALALPRFRTVALTANNRNELKKFTLAPGQAVGVNGDAPVVDRFEASGRIASSSQKADSAPVPAFAGPDYAADSKSSLSAIQGNLKFYAAASAQGENGREPPSRGSAGKPANTLDRLATRGEASPDESLGFGYRPLNSKPTDPSVSGVPYSRRSRGRSGGTVTAEAAAPQAPAAPSPLPPVASPEAEPSEPRSDTSRELIIGRSETESFDSDADIDNMLADPFGSVISPGQTGVEDLERRRQLSLGEKSMPAGGGLGGGGGGYGGGGMGGFGRRGGRYAETEIDQEIGAGDLRELEESRPDPSDGPISSDDYSQKNEGLEAAAGDKATPVEVDREMQMMITPRIIIQEEQEVATPADRSGSDRHWAGQHSPQLGRDVRIWSRSGDRRTQGDATGVWDFDTLTSGTETQSMESFGESTESLPSQFGINSDGVTWWGSTDDDDGLERSSQRRTRSSSDLRRQAVQPGTKNLSSHLGTVLQLRDGRSLPASKSPVPRFVIPAGLNEKSAEDDAFSTFSLHVSDVSFKLAQAALAQGQWPDAATVRIEEFVNAFDYGDPMPSQSEKVACNLEQAIHPFLQQRNLLRVSMRTAATGRSGDTPLRLTFLLDNSGSMERIDRQQTVRRAFALLAQQLKPIDQVTLISFARQPRLLADKVSGAESQQLVQLIHDLPSEGGTNLEAALQLAFEKAQEQRVDHAQNRIIMLTDGAANLGDADPASLSQAIERIRSAGIAFDAAGISAAGLNDELLEALTRKGDGRYYLLDRPENVDDGFTRQIAGALRPAAKNVKVQIEFNPRRVGRYKLLGFEKHRLKKKDFRDDTVDAAEMAAAEAGVALYQFEAKPDGEGDVGSVSVRFRDMSTGEMVENRWPIPYEADAPHPDQAAPSLRIATSAALLAAKLSGQPLGATVDLKTLSNLLAGLPDRDRTTKRVRQLQQMIQQARQVEGN